MSIQGVAFPVDRNYPSRDPPATRERQDGSAPSRLRLQFMTSGNANIGLALGLAEGSSARTVFHDELVRAVRRSRRFGIGSPRDTLLFHEEEITPELNWPRYGQHQDLFVRGDFDQPDLWQNYHRYLSRFSGQPGRKCLISTQKRLDLAAAYADREDILVADINLTVEKRRVNPRTISLPAMAIARGGGANIKKTILASFSGYLSHPCRSAVARLDNGSDFIFRLFDRQHYVGSVDAAYAALLGRSVFAIVPRGDASYSYRLLESMSFGCIPVIISDAWVLPFDRLIEWSGCCLRVAENDVGGIERLLRTIPESEIERMRSQVETVYERHFQSVDAVVESLAREAEQIPAGPATSPGSPESSLLDRQFEEIIRHYGHPTP